VSRPVIVLGAGGHARVCLDLLFRSGRPVIGCTGADPQGPARPLPPGVAYLGDDGVLDGWDPAVVLLVNGLGSTGHGAARRGLFERFKARGYGFATLVHPAAVLAADVVLGEGAQVMAGAVVQAGTRIGDDSIVNTRAAIDHDCEIGPHVHVAPGATLSGEVTVGAGSHVGTGASVIQGVTIGCDCVVGAGAAVLRPVPDGTTVVGVPARVLVR